MSPRGVPREQIPWYPRIDLDKCIGCQECFNFCGNGVYQWDDDGNHPIVVNPYNCVVGCSACANLCSGEAISFPTKEEIKKVIAELLAVHSQ
ncbi:MAG: 4Fe-4S dicluster domain-containing protein [Anaerolineae bacterium]